jgi:hypothetical protein
MIQLCYENDQIYVCSVENILEPMDSLQEALERISELAKQEPEVQWTDPDTETQYNFASHTSKDEYVNGPRTTDQWEFIQSDWGTNNLIVRKQVTDDPVDPVDPETP